MKIYSFYDAQTGEFCDFIFSGNEAAIRHNTPQGFRAIEGRYDRYRQRVDVVTERVIDHENADVRVAAFQRERADERARVQIEGLERAQHRALREAALSDPEVRAKAIQRLKNIDDEIAALRGDLKGGGDE